MNEFYRDRVNRVVDCIQANMDPDLSLRELSEVACLSKYHFSRIFQIIDIKPYQPCSDRVKNVLLPVWCSEWPKWYEDSATFDWNSVFNFVETRYK
jgi:hypothetical protein